MTVSAPPSDCDILIAGGGLAGLLLAAGWADEKFSALRVCVAEPRKAYVRDRTWSYWRQEPHVLSHLERCTWSRWSVADRGRTVAQSAPGWVYASVDADAVYAHALRRIEAAPHVQMLPGWKLLKHSGTEIQLQEVNSQQAHTLYARRLIDTTARIDVQPSDLVQQFVGWEVNTEDEAFATDAVELMHFERASQGLHFMYGLPYGAKTALIESTWISPAHWQPDFQAELSQALAQRLTGRAYEVTYREQGSLPLIVPPHQGDGVIRLGRSGAALRPATGYAFLNTLAQVQALLSGCPAQPHALAGWQPAVERPSMAQQWMDAVFLRELQSNWETSPERFIALFEKVEAGSLLRFLTGQESWRDRWRVMCALPVRPYLRAAWRHSTRSPHLSGVIHAAS